MMMERRCQDFLDTLQESSHSTKQAIGLIDLTLLDESASDDALASLLDKARQHKVAAVCVYPQHLHYFPVSESYQRATVVNFPEGTQGLNTVLHDIGQIISSQQTDEIDYVFPWQSWLNGQQKEALQHCREACDLSHQGNMVFKVIMETGALPSADHIYQLSQELIQLGCDFLKTSTGKTGSGASPLAAFSMLQAIRQENTSHCGIKLSGGIKKPEQAFLYMDMARELLQREPDKSWFRLGASSLLDELLD